MADLPKPFMIRCLKCRWAERSTGISADLTHLTEIPRSCMNCGTPRQFKCPKCGRPAKMMRIKRSDP